MANSYNSGTKTFSIDTSTNVAGLTALKGSQPDLNDYVCVTGSAVLTIEQSASFRQINVGYAAINGGSGGSYGAALRVLDGVTLTLLAGDKLYVHATAALRIEGTMQTVGVSDGTADQAFALPSGEFTAIQVGGEWWRWVPSLTGWRIQCAATTASTTLNVQGDPRITGLHGGATIEVRDTSTGELIGTRVVTAVGTSTLTLSSAITTTTSHGVYLPIEATEQVYDIVGTTLRFGDGTASAWNNRGGAVPPQGAAIMRPGVLMRSSGASAVTWETVQGRVEASGALFFKQARSANWWTTHTIYGVLSLADCAFDAGGVTANAFSGYANAIERAERVLGMRGTGDAINLSGCIFDAPATLMGAMTGGTCVSLAGCALPDGAEIRADSSASGRGAHLQYCLGGAVDVTAARVRLSGLYALGCVGLDTHVSVDKTGYVAGQTPVFLHACSGMRVQGDATRTLLVGHSVASVAYSSDGCALDIGYDGSASTPIVPGAREPTIIVRSPSPHLSWWPCTASTQAAGLASYQYLVISEPDVWTTSHVMHVPGISAFGAARFTHAANGATLTYEYRLSNDYGRTWTDWKALTSVGISETPDPHGCCVQLSVKATGIGATLPRVERVEIAFTPVEGWSEPKSWKGVVDVAGALRARTERWPR